MAGLKLKIQADQVFPFKMVHYLTLLLFVLSNLITVSTDSNKFSDTSSFVRAIANIDDVSAIEVVAVSNGTIISSIAFIAVFIVDVERDH